MRRAVRDIDALFARHGERAYDGARRESVSAAQHALQCAQLAEWAHASPSLVAAALLHDIGHFVAADSGDDDDDRHELRALPLLDGDFGADVLEPIRLHVAAKRCLVTIDRGYAATLSPASIYSLGVQGGPMSRDEADDFVRMPFAADALLLRRWDDAAKQPGRSTPPLAYYLALLDEVALR